MTILKTATGKSYPCDFMGTASDFGVLYIKLNIDIYEALEVFQDPEETITLVWHNEDTGIDVRTETGFTTFGGFTIMPGKCPVRVRMLKGSI